RGFILSGALAYELKLPLVLVRKKGKLPGDTITEDYELEYGQATIEAHETELIRGHKVLVIDDLLATGGTALAAVRLMRRLGADAVDFAALIDLTELPGRKHLENAGVNTYAVCGFTESE
ncbi:MAG: adenine phosphoribosyltransferase, partial [Verrucomicrobiota bacterium]